MLVPFALLLGAIPAGALPSGDSGSAGSPGPTGPAAETEAPDFARDVRPILARKCFACHGNDEETRLAGLRLDERGDAVKDRGGYAALVPGSLEDSELWARVNDEFDPMPPADAAERLSHEELDLIQRWIESGAEYAPHWAFVPPVAQSPPGESAPPGDGALHPVDAWVRAALAERGLEPSPREEDHRLLRRVSLDLTGLPPSADEARAFAASTEPDKYERAVEALLASPAYAERWAAVWLDLARYADSSGHGSDPLRTIWRYRDWVIEAFDRNLPFDEFTVQQLAGDLLPDASPDTRLATAFHRNTMTNTEGGTDDEEFRVLAVKDRVNTTMQVWTGLTAGCAECHSHKYDPISHHEYYELFALFNQTADTDRNDDAPRMDSPTLAQRGDQLRLKEAIAAVEATLKSPPPMAGAERGALERSLRDRVGPLAWSTDGIEILGGEEETVAAREGGGVLVTGSGASAHRSAIIPAGKRAPTALAVRAFADESLPRGGPGRNSASGNFVLTDLAVRAIDPKARAVPARTVRIELPGTERILSLAEVEVFDAAGEPVAASGEARQSSTAYAGPAQLAIDGETSGVFSDASTTHTATESNPWWELRYPKDVTVGSVRVWSRTDGRLEERLHGFRVVLLDGDGGTVWESARARAPEASVEVGPLVGEPLFLTASSATHEQPGFGAQRAVDAFLNDRDGWAVGGAEGRDHAAVFALPRLSGPRRLEVRLRHDWGSDHVLGSFGLAVSTADEPPLALAADVQAALWRPAEDRTAAERDLVQGVLDDHDPRIAGLRARRDALEDELDALGVVTTPVMEELPTDRRRTTHVMIRGNFLQPDAEVHAAVPAALGSLAEGVPADRLALARWLVADENPLTARVTVNRVWARLFGRGIVATEGDFGSQGAPPTHPELLDWLSVQFVRGGWDHKALLRTLVMSETYRQSSQFTAASREGDPDGVWLSRFPRQRLEAEMVRDTTLKVAGLLSSKRFGPSVFPPQPDGLWRAAFNGQRNWMESEGEDRHRRGLYVFMRRTIPYPMMATFDAPSREVCTVQRIATNTPLQALLTLNDPAFHEAAQAMGQRLALGGEAPRAAAESLLWDVLASPPDPEQVRALVELHASAREAFAEDPEGAADWAGLGMGAGPSSDVLEAAAWTLVAGTALNMDAVLTKE